MSNITFVQSVAQSLHSLPKFEISKVGCQNFESCKVGSQNFESLNLIGMRGIL